MARTIDNLGVETSTRYAEDQEKLAPYNALTKESLSVATQAQIDVTQALTPSELDLLFDATKRYPTWANFSPPPGFYEQRKNRLFTHQILPSLGPDEKTDALMLRIRNLPIDIKKPETSWQTDKQIQEKSKEKETLANLLIRIGVLDKDHSEINRLRNQYQRG